MVGLHWWFVWRFSSERVSRKQQQCFQLGLILPSSSIPSTTTAAAALVIHDYVQSMHTLQHLCRRAREEEQCENYNYCLLKRRVVITLFTCDFQGACVVSLVAPAPKEQLHH